jgi:flavin reductase (DIM6/NTAB) family NADH-FMN oxidoreductase RutF
MKIKQIDITDFNHNVFRLIGSDWMLITSGNKKSFNTMTASWGGLGVLWNKNVVFCFVRPSRFTYLFMEKSDYFTLCFFDENYKDILTFCGTHSGKNINKIEKAGLIPLETSLGNIYFKQAQLVMECEKIYFQDITPKNFVNPSIEQNYNGKDYHRIYIGEVLNILMRQCQ